MLHVAAESDDELGGVNIESKQKTCDSTSTFSDSFRLQPLPKELQDEKNFLSHLDNYCNYLNKWSQSIDEYGCESGAQ